MRIPFVGSDGNKKQLKLDFNMDKEKCKFLDGKVIPRSDGTGKYACIIPPDEDWEIVDITSEGIVKARNPETGETMESAERIRV